MSGTDTTLTANFPKAMRGYAPEAVDDFVRQLGERVKALQTQVEEKTSAYDRISADLEATAKSLTVYIEKEQALARGLVDVEQRRVKAEQEIDSDRTIAQDECDKLVAEARVQADRLLADARAEAEKITAGARVDANDILNQASADLKAQEQRLADAQSQFSAFRSEMRNLLETQLNTLAGFSEPVKTQQYVTAVTSMPVANNGNGSVDRSAVTSELSEELLASY
jgi:DivIVA domain-containing protein